MELHSLRDLWNGTPKVTSNRGRRRYSGDANGNGMLMLIVQYILILIVQRLLTWCRLAAGTTIFYNQFMKVILVDTSTKQQLRIRFIY